MEVRDILKVVDHTLLKAEADISQYKKLFDEHLEFETRSVCIPGSLVEKAGSYLGGRGRIATVVGFPLGYQSSQSKAFEAREAIKNGASDIDMVINIGALKSGSLDYVRQDIRTVREATESHVLKVIVETGHLNQEEKEEICKIVYEERADFIKTSTGFGPSGASIEDVKLFKSLYPNLNIKASGGISTLEEAKDFLLAGADVIGASNLVESYKEYVNG